MEQWIIMQKLLFLTTAPPVDEIPEFPTIALPVLAILGLSFIFMRRKE
ncbi:PEF-CTERM sorting domain-containing protein [Methanococcoides sp. SA1]|nr:PEF-CTERM sorting domain-containing protein [Methanococcoides sp. SA1]